MKTKFALIITVATAVAPMAGLAQSSNTKNNFSESTLKAAIGDLHEITTHIGINDVFFASAHLEGHIIVGSQHGVDVSSHDIFLITVGESNSSSWSVVPLDVDGDKTIENELDDGFYFRSIRLMEGTLHGTPETFLFISTLNGTTYNSPGPTATISVEYLQPDDNLGDPPFAFLPFLQFKTHSVYYDANEALLKELGVPLPTNYPLPE